MSIKALQDYTYYSKYARYNKEEKRRETWDEATDRVKNMHLRKYPEAKEHIEWAFDLVRQKRVLGSQRALQFGGVPCEKKNARIYNCTVSFCDRMRFFQECFWLLLCGSGTGFSCQTHHVAKLPNYFPFLVGKEDTRKEKKFVIPDTIEGWADSLGILMATFMPSPEYPEWEGKKVVFDYSQIRPAGSSLASGVGKAPGPEPLKRSLNIINDLLIQRVQDEHTRLRPIDAYDIVMHASDAVLSGGVRRSATIAIFSAHDEEMATCKTGNWFVDNPQRARSNNSAALLRNDTSKVDFLKLMENIKDCGEPGFYWTDSLEQLPNPCVEIGMWPVEEESGKSGWQFCNLCEINGRRIKCKEDFAIAARAGAIIGTLQAGYTNFDYLGETSEKIVRREALLGVSVTGMMDNPNVLFDADTQKEMAKLVLETNKWMAKLIGINPAARATCVKPAGTTSCLLGTSSGIHPHHAKRYFRRSQANYMEPILQHFKKYNPAAVDKLQWSATGTDEVITFCIEVPDGSKTKNDISAIQLLEHVKNTQQNWVTAGKRKAACTQPWLTHNVSNTINVREDEWDEVGDYIFKNRKHFAGIALLPQSGDLDYCQSPMCVVHTPREILQMYGDGCLFASGLIVDGLHCWETLWGACNAILGLGEPIEEPIEPNGGSNMDDHREWQEKYAVWESQVDWIRRVKQFAERYCEDNLKKCTYLLKETNNWKTWLDLTREYQEVDYTELMETEDNTKISESLACSGGACEVI